MTTTPNIRDGLNNLTEDGIPETMISTARQAQDIGNQLFLNDQERSWKRARVAGLVDGNPPYSASAKRAAGRAGDLNINFRVAESYLENAKGAFYDIFSEVPTFATCVTELKGDGSDQWSGIITEEFDRLQRYDPTWDATMQLSQGEMVLYGPGPLMFQDSIDWRCEATLCKNLLVPDDASSNVEEWEYAFLRVNVQPHKLYGFIKNPKAASDVGWDVKATRRAIMNARPETEQGGLYLNWEWHQQQLKDGAYNYSFRSKVIPVFHTFYREFPKKNETSGKISHAIVLQDSSEGKNSGDFLFRKIGKYNNWKQCVHPMYYAHGRGGKHHSVTGMGIKMFAIMELQNRTLCNIADKAFAPKVLFKPTNATGKQKFSMVTQQDFGVLSPGYDVAQVGINGFMQDQLVFSRELTSLLSSNLSQYRTNLQEKSGNPITAREADIKASQAASLGKTQLNRYYEQLDAVYAEKFRRAANPKLTEGDPGGKEALEFQKRCKDRGVPAEALQKMKCVKATRVVGQGSTYMRQQSLEFLLGMVAMFPEDGRSNLIKDIVAGRAGQFMVDRYYPETPGQEPNSAQNVMAKLEVAAMKVGINPGIEPHQNPMIFAQTFVQAGMQAAQSVSQGANPLEVVNFLDLVGPAALAHIQRMGSDPTRKGAVDGLTKQLNQLASFNDELKSQIQKEQQRAAQSQAAQQKAQAIQAGVDPETQIDAAKVQAKIELDKVKANAAMELKREKQDQQMALADAKTSAGIVLSQAKAKSKTSE